MRILALCHGRNHGFPEGRGGKDRAKITTVDINASVLPHFVADVRIPGVFGRLSLTDRYDVVECVGYNIIGNDEFQVWDNMASATRKDGKGYIVMEMNAGSLVEMMRYQNARHRVKFPSYASYDPVHAEEQEVSSDQAALDEAYVEFITSVTNPARRYGNGKLQLVSVPLHTAPEYVQTYACERPDNRFAVFRVVLRSSRERIVVHNMRVRKEHEAFVEGLVNCAKKSRVDELETRLRSPHYALRTDDVYQVVDASLSARRVDAFRRLVFDVFGDVLQAIASDLIDTISSEIGAVSPRRDDFTTHAEYIRELAEIQAEIWSTCIAGYDDKAEMRTFHVGYAKRYIKNKTVLDMVAKNMALRRLWSS